MIKELAAAEEEKAKVVREMILIYPCFWIQYLHMPIYVHVHVQVLLSFLFHRSKITLS